MKIEDFDFKGHEKIVEKGVIMDGNVTWSIHDDLGKHRKETQQMVEEHSTYRVLAIATTVGIMFAIIYIVAIVFICLYHRYKAANPNKHSKQPKSPIELSHAKKLHHLRVKR